MRTKEVVEYYYHHFQWTGKSKEEVTEEITQKVIQRMKTQGKALPGVFKTIDFLKQQPIHLALASSSSYQIIHTVLSVLQLENIFEVVRSAEEEEYGKPHPAIYVKTAACLQVSPLDCVAIEDSVNGVIACKAARMKCIAVPNQQALQNPKYAIADLLLPSLHNFRKDAWDQIHP